MIKQRRWWSIAFTNFLGVFNDNAYKCAAIAVLSVGLSSVETQKVSAWTSIFLFLPFVLFSFIGGYCSDNFPRHRVIMVTKVFEIGIMCFGAFALLKYFTEGGMSFSKIEVYVILFIMAFQSTIFSPTRSGIMPQLFTKEEISYANGSADGFANIGIIVGVLIGTKIIYNPNFIYILPVFSILGYISSLFIPKVKKVVLKNPKKRIPLRQILSSDIKICLFMEMLFYTLAAAILTLIFSYIKEGLFIDGVDVVAMAGSDYVGNILLALTIGIGIGSILAGKLSRGHIELGLVFVGIFGMAISIFILAITHKYYVALFSVVFLGVSCGFYVIPVRSYLQYFSNPIYKGRVLGFSNTLSFLGMTAVNILILYLADSYGARDFMKIFCIVLLFMAAFILLFIPHTTGRFILSIFMRFFYKVEIVGEIPRKGAVLLLPNHVTWIDGLLLSIVCNRPIVFIITEEYYNLPIIKHIFRRLGFISLPNQSNPKGIVNAFKEARNILARGDVLCIFPEGRLTRSGVLGEFKSGYQKFLPKGKPVSLVPVHFAMIWGSIFSTKKGHKFGLRFPKRIPYPVRVSFSSPLAKDCEVMNLRKSVEKMGQEAFIHQVKQQKTIPHQFYSLARRRPFKKLWHDSEGNSQANISLLLKAFIFSNFLKKELKGKRHVGIILPSSIPAIILALASWFSVKIPVFLNFTSGKKALQHAIELCEMNKIFTSKLFVKKIKLQLPQGVEVVYLEDIIKQFSLLDKLKSIVKIFTYNVKRHNLDDDATILFSSGSTGMPKGIRLSQYNLVSNILGFAERCNFSTKDIILASLPLFHSFGFIANLSIPLFIGNKTVYFPNPLDAKRIGELIEIHKVNFMAGTPTFLKSYYRRCRAELFSSLSIVLSGAERLHPEFSKQFFEKFGVFPLNSYGATELAPGICINVPNDMLELGKVLEREESVGCPLPGVMIKVVDESGQEVSAEEEGVILVSGSNVMQGYLKDEAKAKAVLKNGWYNTKDRGYISVDGYLYLTGRSSRFSKIGGEMISHIAVEDALHKTIAEHEQQVFVICGMPSSEKGEKLIVFYLKDYKLDIEKILANIEGLPNIANPKRKEFYAIDEIPLLGSGKIDLAKINQLAQKVMS